MPLMRLWASLAKVHKTAYAEKVGVRVEMDCQRDPGSAEYGTGVQLTECAELGSEKAGRAGLRNAVPPRAPGFCATWLWKAGWLPRRGVLVLLGASWVLPGQRLPTLPPGELVRFWLWGGF